MILTQAWRALSEKLRADFRGIARKLSAYQAMAILVIIYQFFVVMNFEAAISPADIRNGLNTVWNPIVMLLCQVHWMAVFLITGRSMVTGSTLTFFIHQDRI